MSAPLLEMSKAEDDEIILHEVIIEPTSLQTVSKSDDVNFSSPTVDTSDKSHGHKSLSLMNVLRQISPKIAPKFPREKLKSMIRKSRKISPGFPYHKVKGVTFSTDTKSDDDDESEQSSLLDLSVNDPLEVEITLSTPELTEIEKRMGVHPYCFLRDHISPSEPVPTFRSPSLARDQDKTEAHFPGYTVESVTHQIPETPTRSQSLPNIHEGVMKEGGIRSLVMVPSLNKYHHIREKCSRTRKRQKRKKSPPPLLLSGCEREFLSNTQSEFEQIVHSSESSSRRNTLPKITVTRWEQKSPDHLDLATAASGKLSSDSSNINNKHPSQDKQNSRESKSIEKSPTAYSFSEDPSPDCSKTFQRPKSLKYSPDSSATGIQKSRPPHKQMSQKHSTPQGSTKLPSTSSTCSPASAQPSKASTSSAKSKILPKFTPSPQTYSKKGFQNVSDSAPSTPTSDIPPVFRVSRSPSFPNASLAPQRPKSLRSSSTPVSSQQTPEVEARSPVSQESVRQSVAGIVSESDGKAISFQRTKTGDHSHSPETSPGPPRPPPRPAPRRGSRGKNERSPR